MRTPSRCCRLAGRALALAILLAAAPVRSAGPARPPEVIVRLRADGPHAITECAAAQVRSGRPLGAIARDRSDSLDRLNAELGVRGIRAVFRRSDGRPLAAQEASLAARAHTRREALPASLQARLPAVPSLAEIYRIELAPGADAAAAAARYAADPHVAWAHASVGISADLAANDPYLASSGAWGQPYPDLWGILRVRAPEAWDFSQGEGVVVAVVDTGIDTHHPDLAANIWVNPGEDLNHNGVADPSDFNGVDDDHNGLIDDVNGFDFANSVDANGDGDYDDPGDVSDPDPFDDYGHGTHVAGTIAAVANNGIGVAGVAPRARLMAVKGLKAQGDTPDSVLARAMVYAADNGARVINNSWSCSGRCPHNAVLEEAQAYAASLGVVVVTSAGNSADDVVFYAPKWRRDNIVVGASDDLDRLAPFSNLGFLVSVVAPGSGEFFTPGIRSPQRAILSTRSSGAGLDADGGGVFTIGGEYLRWVGTSMSAPHVSGIAALVLALHPDYSPDDVRAVIRSAAHDLGAPGFDRATGAGLADAASAVQAALPAVRAIFSDPAPGAVIVPTAETVEVRGAVTGPVVDASLAVGFGSDPARFDPIPLASPLPGTDGELARWDVSARDDGPYVLRLEVNGGDGSHAIEFLPVSLERNAPTVFSSPGVAAFSPTVSGETVVWESPSASDDSLGLELFARSWSKGDVQLVVSAPGDQHLARLSGDRLAWFDARDPEVEVRSCRLDTKSANPCRDRIAGAGNGEMPPSVSGESVVWSGGELGAEQLMGCRWRGPNCLPLAFPPSARRQLEPILSGSRLWWREQDARESPALTCSGFPRRCDPKSFGTLIFPASVAGSQTRFVWAIAGLQSSVYLCRATASGECPPRLLGTFAGTDVEVAISRHRVVWSAGGPAGGLDVYFCEDDRLTGACPVQRLTGSAADQRNPDVAGTRVVWEDNRDGVTTIAGFELPSLARVRDQRAVVGRPLRIQVRGRDPSGGTLALGAAFADGTPLAARGATFTDHGDGTGELVWTPRAADAGTEIVTFAGRTTGHLTTRRSAQIEVVLKPLRAAR